MKKTLLVSLIAIVSTVFISGFILSASADESDTSFFGRMFGGGKEKMIENKAKVLGISSDDLQAKLDSGMKFPEIFEESGITHEEMREQMYSQKIEGIDTLVSEGKISAEYGEEMKENMEIRHQEMEENGFEGFGKRMGEKHGSMFKNGECNCDNQTE